MGKIRFFIHDYCVGIKIGYVGIGLMKYPWINMSNLSDKSIFWAQLFCTPQMFTITGKYKKACQLRFMWFVIAIAI